MKRECLDRSLVMRASILTALIILFSFELYTFARVQDIWVDETTQLSGITLKLWDMLHWLSGVDVNRFGVPGDRMPPVSYLFDWLWLRLAGPSELGFRLFHSAFVITGLAVLATAAWRGLGPAAATVILTFLILSPKLISTAVEIRAYPIFFALTCVQVAIFLRLLTNPHKVDLKLLAAFALICLIAIYTHFYGLVSSCAFFFALGIAFIRSAASLTALVGAFAAVVIGSLGIIPFVSSAVSESAPTIATGRGTSEYFTYLLKLLGDSANMISIFGSLSFFGGTLALLLAGMIAAFTRMRHARSQPSDWLVFVVIAGALAPIMVSFVVRTFNVMNAAYSGWLFAPLGLLIGVGAISLTGFRAWDRAGRFVAVGMTVIGAAVSTYIFLVNATMFVHGPQRFVSALFDKAAGPKAIVYEVGAAWGFSYFPLAFSHNSEIVQYRAAENGVGLIRIGGNDSQPAAQNIESAVADYNDLIVVDIRLRTFRDLRECHNQSSSCSNFARGAVERMLTATGEWRESKVRRSFGLYDTQVKILERVSGRLSCSPTCPRL